MNAPAKAKHTTGWEIHHVRELLLSHSATAELRNRAREPMADPQLEANARLIAAAPYLLAALRLAENIVRADHEADPDGNEGLKHVYETICAAISKAESAQ